MSAQDNTSQPKQREQRFANDNYHATLLLSGMSGPFIGSSMLTNAIDECEVQVKFVISSSKSRDSSVALYLSFPLADHNEDLGFGASFRPDAANQSETQAGIAPTLVHDIKIVFPRGKCTFHATDVTGLETFADPLKAMKKLALVSATLHEGAELCVEGFGIPFANEGHRSHAWINNNAPLLEGDSSSTLLAILARRKLEFLVPEYTHQLEFRLCDGYLPPPFEYPYGAVHTFDVARYRDIIPKTRPEKDEQFMPRFNFPSDNDHITALTQGAVQDFFWLNEVVEEIRTSKTAAYFVPKAGRALDETDVFYVILSPREDFATRYKDHWNQLAQQEFLKLRVYEDWNEDPEATPTTFRAQIRTNKGVIDELRGHVGPETPLDFVLGVEIKFSEKLKIFGNRGAAEAARKNCVSLVFDSGLSEAKRKVQGALCFAPDAKPEPPVADGEDAADTAFRMKLARDVMRGTGFYHTLVGGDPVQVVKDEILDIEPGTRKLSVSARTLPVVNFLDIPDAALVDAICREALDVDLDRCRSYLSNRPLGIALMAGPAGTGKTTAACVAVVAMIYNPTIGKVFGSGPTNVAISNFAERLYGIGVNVVDRYNKTTTTDKRIRRPLVVRGFRLSEECKAFRRVLELGNADDSAAPTASWSPESVWSYALTPVNWLLVILGSKAARDSVVQNAVLELHEDDHPGLHQLRIELATKFTGLCQFLRGEMDWQQYKEGHMITNDELETLFRRIIGQADAVLSTPSQSCVDGSPYEAAKLAAKGIAIDEAGCMHRTDLACVWGNTLRPLVLAGDSEQLLPAVMEPRNRFAPDVALSPLAFLQGSGLPVYRLRTQLRMVDDQFSCAQELVYKKMGLELKYASWCTVEHPSFALGVAFDKFVRDRFPGVKASPEGKLSPIWMHTHDTVAKHIGTSKRNAMQVDMSLRLLSEFVDKTGFSAKDIVGISPYKPNVAYANSRVRDFPLLHGKMPPVKTVDSFQGLEGELVVVIFGTTAKSGPGFTGQKNRLNVMLTRQKSMLLLVGDMAVTGPLEGKEGRDADKAATKTLRIPGPGGEVSFSKPVMLRALITMMRKSGRFFEMRDEEGEEKMAAR